MKISNEIYKKIVKSYNLQCKLRELGSDIEKYLIKKCIDMEKLRWHDAPFVDMVDYGNIFLSKEDLEKSFEDFVLQGTGEKKDE